ncbi:hypothetical protein C882_2391 [Caenispirillum salinarum AK4]|uniref:Uncharacterized protein n=1 Tax=Caenispirillum salinarum AK4 TaxID=1238182 RepID=K9HPV3_9PROT|nr:hypothetical protein [Caenispirillum salinarum]EKV32313.1 hypothetical protein C882_2391 [Caenispirillum salinarum AK4]
MSRRRSDAAPAAAPPSSRVSDAFPPAAEVTEGSRPRKPRRYNPHEAPPPPPSSAAPPPPDGEGGPMTLWNLVQFGIDVFCWCNRCSHHAVLPVRVLAVQMGPATPVPAVAAHVVCSGCGGREVATRPAWPPRGPVSRHSPTPTGGDGGDGGNGGDAQARVPAGAPSTGDDPA